jgi:hypothetical protein
MALSFAFQAIRGKYKATLGYTHRNRLLHNQNDKRHRWGFGDLNSTTPPVIPINAISGAFLFGEGNAPLMKCILQPMATVKSANYPQGQYVEFVSALRKILRVSHAEMQQKLAEERRANASKRQPSSRASRDKT